MMTAAAGAQSGTALPAIVSAFSMLAVALFLANVAHEIQGFDQYMSCGHGNEREPKQFRFPPQLPCDFSSENHCNVPGESYPWQAVRRFVYENHGLMRRMYGDVRQGSILREEFVHHHPDDEVLDDDDQNDVPEHDVRHRYTHDRNINNVYSSSNDLGSSSEAASHPDHYQNQAETQRQQRHNARAPRHHRQRQFQFDTVGDGDNAWNQPYFGDVVAGVANDLDGGTRQRQPSVRRGRELSGQHHFTANHIPAFEEKEKVSGRDAAEEVQIIGDEIRFQGLLPTAQLEAIANVQYIHSTHHQRLQPGTGAKFSFGHQSHHSYYDQPNGDANEQQKTDQPNDSSTKEAPAMATTTGAPTVTTSSAPSSSQSPATSSMMPSATPAAVLMTADNRSDSDNGNKTSRPAEFNVSPQPTVTSNNSSDQSFTASSPASSSSPSVLESFERTDIWGDDDGDDVTGATERGTAGTERPSGTKRGSSTTRVTTSAAATTETASAAGMASLPNTEASSLVLEERKKSTSIPAASSVPLTTSTTDGDGTAPSAETMMSEDYYQQTSDIATEQPPPPKTTSQRPNNKYSKMKGINACPVKEEVVAPYWANNTRGEVLALLNLYPFEQYIHWEKCTYEHKQMYCRDGCRCEQQYRLHRLLAFDPNNECRGIFSDWFKFPSCCVCKCYDLPFLRPAGESADDEESAPSGEAMMSPRENPSAGGGEDGATLTSAATNEEEDDSRDLYSQRTPRFRNYLDAEIDFGPANIEPLDQADYLAYQLSQVQEEQLKLQQQQLELERGYHGGYSPDDRAVMDADEIVGPAYAYYEPGYPGNDLVEPKGGDEVVEVKDTNRFAYDGKYGKTNASAPLPLIRQPRGAKN